MKLTMKLSERITNLDSEYGAHLHAGLATEIGKAIAALEQAIESAIPECETGNWHKARAILEDVLDE